MCKFYPLSVLHNLVFCTHKKIYFFISDGRICVPEAFWASSEVWSTHLRSRSPLYSLSRDYQATWGKGTGFRPRWLDRPMTFPRHLDYSVSAVVPSHAGGGGGDDDDCEEFCYSDWKVSWLEVEAGVEVTWLQFCHSLQAPAPFLPHTLVRLKRSFLHSPELQMVLRKDLVSKVAPPPHFRSSISACDALIISRSSYNFTTLLKGPHVHMQTCRFITMRRNSSI